MTSSGRLGAGSRNSAHAEQPFSTSTWRRQRARRRQLQSRHTRHPLYRESFSRIFVISIHDELEGLQLPSARSFDDAIVDVENVVPALRLNSAEPAPKPALLVIFQLPSEVRESILIGTLLVVSCTCRCFPDGMEGKLFTPIGIAYIVSTLGVARRVAEVTPVLFTTCSPTRKPLRITTGWLVRNLRQSRRA